MGIRGVFWKIGTAKEGAGEGDSVRWPSGVSEQELAIAGNKQRGLACYFIPPSPARKHRLDEGVGAALAGALKEVSVGSSFDDSVAATARPIGIAVSATGLASPGVTWPTRLQERYLPLLQ